MTKGDTFPLLKAYPFGWRKGLGPEIERIKNTPVHWPQSHQRTYSANVRRGMIIRLFRGKSILDEFITSVWRQGLSPNGQKEMERRETILQQYEKVTRWPYRP